MSSKTKIIDNLYDSDSDVTTLVIDHDLKPFRVTWKELTYTVRGFNGREKTIVNGVSGYFDSGKITAIMGPSGGGKSSLLGCLSKQKTIGVTGSITISTNINVKFAFIQQDNYILDKLSVRESLMFASRLKNDKDADHTALVEEVIKKLMLEKCADNRPSRCSGGQLKRVLIACELVSKPNILILDEPTSGLDSVTTWSLINLLVDLTRQPEPQAVVLTIHQPSARLFNLLDQIYLMSCEGQCIYHGPPEAIVSKFREFSLYCPNFTNPADFALEVAAKEHGRAPLLTLSTVRRIEAMEMPINKYEIKIIRRFRTLDNIFYLTERSLQTMLRDMYMLPARVVGYIICSQLISLFFGWDSGYLSGCPQEFTIGDGQDLFEKYKEHAQDIIENCCGLAFICMFCWFGGLFPVLLIFPTELNVFMKEYGNGYYSAFQYFMSKILSDLPFSLILPNIASLPLYLMTGQFTGQIWRLFNFMFIYFLININSSALGFLLGASLSDYPTAIAFIGLLSIVPLILLSGIMIRFSVMPMIFQWISELDFFRFGLVAVLVNSYGFHRCDLIPSSPDNQTDVANLISDEKMLEIYSIEQIDSELLVTTITSLLAGLKKERPIVMEHFDLFDIDYFRAVVMLFAHMIAYRLITYKIITMKINARS